MTNDGLVKNWSCFLHWNWVKSTYVLSILIVPALIASDYTRCIKTRRDGTWCSPHLPVIAVTGCSLESEHNCLIMDWRRDLGVRTLGVKQGDRALPLLLLCNLYNIYIYIIELWSITNYPIYLFIRHVSIDNIWLVFDFLQNHFLFPWNFWDNYLTLFPKRQWCWFLENQKLLINIAQSTENLPVWQSGENSASSLIVCWPQSGLGGFRFL